MSDGERHVHFCDCDDCLNGGAGVKLTSLPLAPPRRELTGLERRAINYQQRSEFFRARRRRAERRPT